MEFIRAYFHTPCQEELNSSLYITWAGHRICASDHQIGPRVLDNYKIVLAIKGRGIFRQEAKEMLISGGDIFVLFPGVKHFYCADPTDPWEIMWVSFNGKICEKIMQAINLTPSSPVIVGALSPELVQLFTNIIDDLEYNNDIYPLKAIGNLHLLFSQLLVFTRSKDRIIGRNKQESIIQKALKFIELNYYHQIDVELLCTHVNYSRSYFSRLFKKEVGVSIPEYINQVRIRHAKALLKNTDLNINEVARSVGFNDPFYFSRKFKMGVGMPPIQYKTIYRKDNIRASG